MLLIEGAGGAAAIESIAELENVDVLFIGPVDLSHSLGVPGQPDHPRVAEKVAEVVEVAGTHGKAIGIFVDDLEKARSWMKAGVQFIAFGVDSAIVFKAFRRLAADLTG